MKLNHRMPVFSLMALAALVAAGVGGTIASGTASGIATAVASGFATSSAAGPAQVSNAGALLPPPLENANPPWVPIGPEGGNVVGLDHDRADPARIFAALGNGGVFRSDNGGESWARIAPGSGSPFFTLGLAVDPTDSRRIYLLHEQSVGLSRDGGASWQSRSLPPDCYARCGPVIDPAAPDTIYAAGSHAYDASYDRCMALFKSTDGGESWSCIDIDPDWVGYSVCMAISPSAPNVLYVGGSEKRTFYEPKIFKTVNGGGDWADVTWDYPPCYPQSLAVHPLDPNRVFGGSNDTYVFRTLDGGSSWTPAVGQPAGLTASELAIDPRNPNVLYSAGDYGCAKSIDGGATWAPASVGLAGSSGDLRVIGDAVLRGGTEGVHRSDDGGATWRVRNAGLLGLTIDGLGVAPSRPETIFAQAIEKGLMKTPNAGESWQDFDRWPYLPARIVAHPADADHVHFVLRGNSLFESFDGGATVTGRLWLRVGDFTLSPSNPARAYATGAFLRAGDIFDMAFFASTDGGTTWSEIMVGAGAPSWGYAVAVEAADPETAYVGGSQTVAGVERGAVYKTVNGGASWVDVSGSISGLVRVLAADPGASGTVYAGTEDGIFRTMNGGASWASIGAFDVAAIETDPDNAGWLYAGGADGVFGSADYGTTWFALDNGFPDGGALSLDLDRTHEWLYAGTTQGVWRTALPLRMADISGTVTVGGLPLSGVTLTFSNAGGSAYTDTAGRYMRSVPAGWSGTVTPALVGYGFTPAARTYLSVASDLTDQDYTALGLGFSISGTVRDAGGAPLAGVVMTGLPGNPVTDAMGAYAAPVGVGWTGTVWPRKTGYTFTPAYRSYAGVAADAGGQDYTGESGPAFENSAAPVQILPEVVWADASGGGTWVTEIQVIDVTGGSAVDAWFNAEGMRRGPIALWGGTAAHGSLKIANVLEILQALDPSFAYFGRIGALELRTRDADHRILAAARIVNGDYGKTAPGLSDTGANAACLGMDAAVQSLASTSAYRSFAGAFNPGDAAVTVEFTLHGSGGETIGSAFTRTFAGRAFGTFDPFAEAGRPYPEYSCPNAWLRVRATAGTGRLMVFGASASNASNDPAAHPAVTLAQGWHNSPAQRLILPEVIWAGATGGGTWVSEVQVTDLSGGSVVQAWFSCGDGVRRGPVALWTGAADGACYRTANLLQVLGERDPAFEYRGRVGAVELVTQDEGHLIMASVRTVNGGAGKTMPGVSDMAAASAGVTSAGVEAMGASVGTDMGAVGRGTGVAGLAAGTVGLGAGAAGLRSDAAGPRLRSVGAGLQLAETDRRLVLQNLVSNAVYRTFVGCFNPTASGVQVEFRLVGADGSVVGAFTRSLGGWAFVSFDPFAAAGIGYPAAAYDNVWLEIAPTAGEGRVIAFGSSANNSSNDTAAHVGAQLR